MAKKQLTIKQKAKKEKRIANLLFASEFIAIPTPFIIMGAVNYEEWFAQNPDSWTISVSGVIAITLMSFIALLVGLKKENKEITGGYLVIIFFYYMIGFIAWGLEAIMHEIKEIIWITGTGLVGAMVLDNQSKKMNRKSLKHYKAIDNAQEQEDTEQARKELNMK